MNKNYFIALIFLFTIAGCKKGSDPSDFGEKPEVPSEAYKKVLAETGCKVKNAENIRLREILKDTVDHVTFLWGSRLLNGKQVSWMSKYNSEGDVIWDVSGTPATDETSTHAYHLTKMDKDNFAIFEVLKASSNSPVVSATKLQVVNSNTGSVNKTISFKNTYARIAKLKESILIYNLQEDIRVDPKAGTDIIQIDRAGEIVKIEKPIIVMPDSRSVILNDRAFLTTTSSFKILTLYDETLWTPAGNHPTYKSHGISNNVLTINFNNDFKLTETVKFDINSEKVISQSRTLPSSSTSDFAFGDVGTEYTAADGLTVKVNSFTKSANNAGTEYYTISYTLKNNTPDKKILEGTFYLLHKYQPGYSRQYGFFDNLLPGESISRSYVYSELLKDEADLLQYVPSFYSGTNKFINYWKLK